MLLGQNTLLFLAQVSKQIAREQQSPEKKELLTQSSKTAQKQKQRNESEEDMEKRKRQRKECDATRNQKEKAQKHKDDGSLAPFIQKAIKQALGKLHRSKNDDDPRLHSSFVWYHPTTP